LERREPGTFQFRSLLTSKHRCFQPSCCSSFQAVHCAAVCRYGKNASLPGAQESTFGKICVSNPIFTKVGAMATNQSYILSDHCCIYHIICDPVAFVMRSGSEPVTETTTQAKG
jgi:hypothetical protein